MFSFSLPALYVFIAGRNLPPWIYEILIGLAVIGVIDVTRRLRGGLRRPD